MRSESVPFPPKLLSRKKPHQRRQPASLQAGSLGGRYGTACRPAGVIYLRAMAATEPNAVTAAELGELLGVSTRAVADLGKRGIAVKAGPSRWRLRESVARYCDDLRRQAKGKGGEAAAQSGGGWHRRRRTLWRCGSPSSGESFWTPGRYAENARAMTSNYGSISDRVVRDNNLAR